MGRGDVKQVTDVNGQTLYYFPRKAYGTSTKFGTKQEITKGKETTGAAYDTISAFISNVGWTVQSSQKQLEAITAPASVISVEHRY